MIRKKAVMWNTDSFCTEISKISPEIQVLGQYSGSGKKIECKCLNCGYLWYPLAGNVIRGTQCPRCSKKKKNYNKKSPRHKWDNASFLSRIQELDPNIEIIGEFKKTTDKILCRCRICKTEWSPTANNLLMNRSHCTKCSKPTRGLTEEEFLKKVKEVNDSIEIIGKFQGTKSHITCRCKKCGNIWEPMAESILSGRQCRKCTYLENADKLKYSQQEFIDKLSTINPNIKIIGKYEDIYTKIRCKCAICNNEWFAVPHYLLTGRSCPNCNHSSTSYIEQFIFHSFKTILGEGNVISRDKSAIGKELDIFIPQLKCGFEPGSWKLHEKKLEQDLQKQKLCQRVGVKLVTIYYDFDGESFNDENIITYNKDLSSPSNKIDLINLVEKLFYMVGVENVFIKQDWDRISNIAYACSRKMTTEQFRERLFKFNKNIQVLGEFKNGRTKIECKCLVCNHIWNVAPQDLLAGKGCPNCYNNRRGQSLRHSQVEFVKLVATKNSTIEVIGEYINNRMPIKCFCGKCGYVWEPIAGRLINSKANGCPKCAGTQKLTTEIFKNQMKIINPSIEILGEYKNTDTKVGCLCKKCGRIWQTTPHTLKSGHGCPHCSKLRK